MKYAICGLSKVDEMIDGDVRVGRIAVLITLAVVHWFPYLTQRHRLAASGNLNFDYHLDYTTTKV